jgi:hypothetical protein
MICNLIFYWVSGVGADTPNPKFKYFSYLYYPGAVHQNGIDSLIFSITQGYPK